MRNWQTSNKYLLPERALNLANFIMLERIKILELDSFQRKKVKGVEVVNASKKIQNMEFGDKIFVSSSASVLNEISG